MDKMLQKRVGRLGRPSGRGGEGQGRLEDAPDFQSGRLRTTVPGVGTGNGEGGPVLRDEVELPMEEKMVLTCCIAQNKSKAEPIQLAINPRAPCPRLAQQIR